MKHFIVLAAAALAACATAPPRLQPAPVLADALFAPSPDRIARDDVFALTAPMQRYLAGPIRRHAHLAGLRFGLANALRDDLRIQYDATSTRTAAAAFEARAGNCLSLVILTAAFARELDIPVHYQRVRGFDTWSRSGGLALRSSHVNLVLGPRHLGSWKDRDVTPPLVMDFVPAAVVSLQDTREISEDTVVAMFMNNRAAEILAEGDVARAYWWAREAVRTAPDFASAYNTLGVIYLRHGHAAEAERALRHALVLDDRNTEALINLEQALVAQGRGAEAREVARRLAERAPYRPFHFLDLGHEALARRDYAAAAELFREELARMPYSDEAHFALALANLGLGETRQARKHLALAVDNSTTRERRGLYTAKLEHLKAHAAR